MKRQPTAPRWTLGGPVLARDVMVEGKPGRLLDPCVVRAAGRWHVFASANEKTVYFSVKDFKTRPTDAAVATLPLGHCFVPQVFRFRPQARWHLIGMMPDKTGRYPKFVPTLSTNARIDDPMGWSSPQVLDVPTPEDPSKPVKLWIDFWVICDAQKAHLFGTSNDGRLWRSETPLSQYPSGWSRPVVALTGDFIYASHTYRQDKPGARYITLVTAVGKERRQYQQSYVAEHLEGPWLPEAATWDTPYAGPANIRLTDNRWQGDLVHGEPLRTGTDERLILDRDTKSFLFHGRLRGSGDSLGVLEATR